MAALIVLGSGTAVPTPRRGQAGYFLEGGGLDILLDSGSGSLRALARAGVPLERIRAAFYTHFHPDHTLDLVSLIFALTNPRYHGRVESLAVYGPPGMREFYRGMQALYGRWVTPATYELRIRALTGPVELAGGTVRPFPTLHSKGSRGYRVELHGGGVVAYSGDSGPCDALVDLARGADPLVLECSHPDDAPVEGHLTPRQAGEIAARAGCRRVVLSHFYPECDAVDVAAACRSAFDGEILAAHDGMRLEVGPPGAGPRGHGLAGGAGGC